MVRDIVQNLSSKMMNIIKQHSLSNSEPMHKKLNYKTLYNQRGNKILTSNICIRWIKYEYEILEHVWVRIKKL